MPATFQDLLHEGEAAAPDLLLGRFLENVAGKGLTLYPAQEEAVLEPVRRLGRATAPRLVCSHTW